MAIVGDEIYDYVIKQINQRQSAHGSGQNGDERTLEELTYLNSKTAWIKFASGVSVSSSKLEDLGFAPGSAEISELVGKGLAQKYVLYNGISTITDVNDTHYRLFPFSENGYEASPDYGIIPTPGITDLDVKALNRGSLKKATIKLKVQDRSQLSIIDTLYMRLGYTVLLEWGNSVFLDENGKLDKVGETVVERKNYFFSDNMSKSASYTNVLKLIEYYRKKYCGNYDGMLGKISNFSWTFNQDGSYDVDLTVISWGDVIESLKSNVTANKNTIDFVEKTTIPSQENSIINIKRKDNVLFSLLHAIKYVATSTTGKGKNITIDAVPQGNFVASGSAQIQVKEQKIIYKAKYTLMRVGYDGTDATHKAVASTDFNYKYLDITPENFKVFDSSIKAYPYFKMNQYFQSSITDETKRTTDQWDNTKPSPPNISAPFSNIPNVNNGSFTYQETITRTLGDLTLNITDLINQSKAPGLTDDMFKFDNYNKQTTSTTKPPSGVSFNTVHQTTYPYDKSNGGGWPDKVWFSLSFDKLFSSTIKSLTVNWNHPYVMFGISGVNKFDQLPFFYAGLTNKWGIDGGKNFDLANKQLTYSLPSANKDLQSITNPNDEKVVRIIDEEFEAFIKDNPIPKSLMTPPKYDAKGLPSDENYEFFHRFVANDAGAAMSGGKEFFWRPEFSKEFKVVSQEQFDNPLKDFQFDPKGAFQLNTDPISYYLRFGFLLQILKDKVVFKIDENNDNHKDNSPIFLINNATGSSEMLCIRSATIGQISYDFKTCIVRRDKFTKPWLDPNDLTKGSQKVFPELEVWANEDNIDIQDENKKYTVADTMNVYLNFDFIGQCMQSNTDEKGNTSMYGFINSICSGINKSLGGINNLEPIIDETTNTLNIVDTSPKYISSDDAPIVDRNDPYQLQLYGYTPRLNISADVASYYPTQTPHYESTFARKVNLKTAITPEYATMITVGATAGGYVKGVEATSFAKWNNGIIDRFKQSLLPASLPASSPNATNSNTTSSISTLAQASIEDTLIAYQQVMTKSPNCFGIVP